jgi:cytochrome c oxidase assembly protein Cox11
MLYSGEQVDMPVFFYIDPEFADDPWMRDVKHITLHYTFFKSKYQNLDVRPEGYQYANPALGGGAISAEA